MERKHPPPAEQERSLVDRIDTDDEDSAGVSLWEQGKKNSSICSSIAAASSSTAPLSLHVLCSTFSINQETLSMRKTATACMI